MSFGIMNDAYFTPKGTLIEWINNFLNLKVEKVEECASGALYCHIWDAIHPGTVPMNKVDFSVKYEHDYVKNWKLLQTAFEKSNVTKVIPVQRLIKAKYQDNLEFLQWMYKYCHDMYNGDPNHPDYDAVDKRKHSKGADLINASHFNHVGSKTTKAKTLSTNTHSTLSSNTRVIGKENVGIARPISAKPNNQHQTSSSTQQQHNHNNHHNDDNNNEIIKLRNEIEELRQENSDMNVNKEALENKLGTLQKEYDDLNGVAKDIEKERDFYFNKVLQVESICKNCDNQNLPLLTSIFNTLYSTDDNGNNSIHQTQDKLQKQPEPQTAQS